MASPLNFLETLIQMSSAVKLFFFFVATPLAALFIYLGLETIRNNLFGWVLILTGAVYFIWGAVLLARYKINSEAVEEESGDRSFWVVVTGFIIVAYGAPIEYLYLPPSLPRGLTVQLIGIALVGLGAALHTWSRRTLGRQFTGHVQIRASHRLVTGGPYRYIRHPAYAAYLLLGLGFAIGFSSLIGLLGAPLLMFPGLAYRIGVEEKMLVAHFGRAYLNYAARTKRLAPKIW